MRAILPSLQALLARLPGIAVAPKYTLAEGPLYAELFSADQMERHGKVLAGSHKLGFKRAKDQLLVRLGDNEDVLLGAGRTLRKAVNSNSRITPAGEWLLDNFYLIEEQIRLARRHFPRAYSRELPILASGPSAGLPRVYDIALEAISHGDGRVDPESLNRFVAAYQKSTDLKLGELWAIPQGGDVLRQHTASGLLIDEAAFQPDLEASIRAAQPMLKGGGRIDVVSSANPGYFELLAEGLAK